MKQLSLDPNFQKTHYSVAPQKRGRAAETLLVGEQHGAKKRRPEQRPSLGTTPLRLLSGETEAHAAHRYRLYEQVWGHQRLAIEAILNSANNALFADLLSYIQDAQSAKLDLAFLGMSSNTANNLRILDEFSAFVREDPQRCTHVRLVRLNSKVCINIKAAVRETVKQIVEGPAFASAVAPRDDSVPKPEPKGDGVDSDSDADSADGESDAGEFEPSDDEAKVADDGGRISYDFEIVEDWVDNYRRKYKSDEALRLVIILDDSDAFSNEILNQLVQVFCVHAKSCPIKLVMGLSTHSVGEWINMNITSNLRTLIQGAKLEAKDNRQIGYQVIDEILLQNEITAENPLLLDAQLSSIILNRFENSNNSIDSLITELKLTYMIHFYQSPLAPFIDESFQPAGFHYSALRKLPSFKAHIEYLVHKAVEAGCQESKRKAIDLLREDSSIQQLVGEAKVRFQKYQNSVMNAVSIIHWLGEGTKQKFQIYKLVTNNQVINSAFLSDLLRKVKAYGEDKVQQFVEFVNSEAIKEVVCNHTDQDVSALRKTLSAAKDADLVQSLTDYLHGNKNLNMKISDNIFNEVLTINGGISELDDTKPTVFIEENYQNLMIDLIRPNTREVIEFGLDEPQRYIRNSLLLETAQMTDSSARVSGPVLSKLYQVYKDAPVNINLWDFFTAFRQSLSKAEILRELTNEVQGLDETHRAVASGLVQNAKENEDAWDKMVYGWFIQSCFELQSMGFLREKPKGEYVEKMIWKNL